MKGIIDAASRGGGVFLSLAPKGDATIPEAQVAVLGEIGDWLGVHSEAIHGTRPWRIQAEGDVERIWSGKLGTGWRYHLCDEQDIRFTCTKEALYAMVMGWQENGTLDVASLHGRIHLGEGDIRSVQLLGDDRPLTWTRDGQGLHIALPPERPHDHAYVFKIQVDGDIDVDM